MTSSTTGALLNDVTKVQSSLIVCSLTGFVYACLILYFLSNFAETIAWTSIIGTQITLIAASVFCFLKRNQALGLIKSENLGDNNHVNKFSMESFAGMMMFAGILLAFLALLYLVLVFYKFKHVKTAIHVIDAAAEFMVGNKRVVAVPFVYFLIMVAIVIGWFYCIIAIIGLNEIKADPT
jgi:hypothetical protein